MTSDPAMDPILDTSDPLDQKVDPTSADPERQNDQADNDSLETWKLPAWLGDEEQELGILPDADGASPSSVMSAAAVEPESPTDQGTPSRPATTERVQPTQSAGTVIRGNVETATRSGVGGWVSLSHQGREVPLPTVRVLGSASQVLGEAVASGFRQDVLEAGLGTGWGGFAVSLTAATDGPGEVVVQVRDAENDGEWHQVAIAVVEPDLQAAPLNPATILATFAAAEGASLRIGRSGLTVGSGLWAQAASSLIDQVTLRLHLAAGESGSQRQPVVRLTGEAGASGRVDLRLALGPHSQSMSGGWVRLRVFPRAGRQQTVRINVHAHDGRRALGDFVLRSHQWSTLHVKVPPHQCSQTGLTASDDVLWLEVVLDAAAQLDVSAPEVVARDVLDPFECLNVELQQSVFASAPTTPVPATEPYTVVIPYFGKVAYTAACLSAIFSCSWGDPEVVLIDDGSPRANAAGHLLDRPAGRVRTVRSDTNRGYTASVNTGVQHARTDKVIILNNDTRVSPGWDAPLLAALEDPEVFAAGPLSNAASYQSVPNLRENGEWAVNVFGAGVTPDGLAAALRAHFGAAKPIDFPIPNGFCYAVRRAAFLDLGGLDEEAFPDGYGEEIDLMLRARSKGLRNVVTPNSFVYHYKSVTFAERSCGVEPARHSCCPAKRGRQNWKTPCDRWTTTRAFPRSARSCARSCRNSVARARRPWLTNSSSSSAGDPSPVESIRWCKSSRLWCATSALAGWWWRKDMLLTSDVVTPGRLVPSSASPAIWKTCPTEPPSSPRRTIPWLRSSSRSSGRASRIYYYVPGLRAAVLSLAQPATRNRAAVLHPGSGGSRRRKDRWLERTMLSATFFPVVRIRPSIDRSMYYPRPRRPADRRAITAMLRPATSRRGALRTAALLNRLAASTALPVDVNIFGTSAADLANAGLTVDQRIRNHGRVSSEAAAAIVRSSDVLIDLSDYQAFGRTVAEGMAAGVVPVVTRHGAPQEFVENGVSGYLVAPEDLDRSFARVHDLVTSGPRTS